MQSGDEKRPPVGERIVEFIQGNRKPIYVFAAAAVLLLVGSMAALILADVLRGRAIAAVEELGIRYEALRGGVYPDMEIVDGELADLHADLRFFASRHSRYAGGRAWSMVGSIYGGMGAWADAEAAWLAAARATPRSYMAPIALFNAAVAAEEQGDRERAILHYTQSVAAPAGFFAAPRAKFSIGRILESMGDYYAAVQAYRDVVSGWPHEVVWTNLARSRIIAIETSAWRLGEPMVRPPAEVPVTWPDVRWFEDDGALPEFAGDEFITWPPVLDFQEPEAQPADAEGEGDA